MNLALAAFRILFYGRPLSPLCKAKGTRRYASRVALGYGCALLHFGAEGASCDRVIEPLPRTQAAEVAKPSRAVQAQGAREAAVKAKGTGDAVHTAHPRYRRRFSAPHIQGGHPPLQVESEVPQHLKTVASQARAPPDKASRSRDLNILCCGGSRGGIGCAWDPPPRGV
jgi:hypothetical protein